MAKKIRQDGAGEKIATESENKVVKEEANKMRDVVQAGAADAKNPH